jgi:sec-independent protein translocase protein TatA
MFSFTHIILVLLVALVLFGPNKLPEVGRTLGKAIREFRKASREFTASLDDLDLKDGDSK